MAGALQTERYMEEERAVLEDDLLETFDVDGYDIVSLADEAEEQYRQEVEGAGTYDLPVINVGGFGKLRPTYFVVEEDDGQEAVEKEDYAVAVEPTYRSVLVEDPELEASAEEFVEEWEDEVNELYAGSDEVGNGIALHRMYDTGEEQEQEETSPGIVNRGVGWAPRLGVALFTGYAGALVAPEDNALAGGIIGLAVGTATNLVDWEAIRDRWRE